MWIDHGSYSRDFVYEGSHGPNRQTFLLLSLNNSIVVEFLKCNILQIVTLHLLLQRPPWIDITLAWKWSTTANSMQCANTVGSFT